MKNLNEKQILNLIIKKMGSNNVESHFGKDDISLIPLNYFIGKGAVSGSSLCVTCDMLVEHTDVPPTMTFEQIARKSIVSSISDLVSKGIKPKCALVSLGLPSNLTEGDISKLVDGFDLVSKEFKIEIIGGDINESEELVIDCCMFGVSFPNVFVPRRNGAQIGDYIFVTGVFGYTAAGLKILMHGIPSPDPNFEKESINSVLNPTPAYDFGISLAHYFTASTDSSDGMATALYEISKQSGVDMLIYLDKIPIPPNLKEFSLMNNLGFNDLVFFGGEEYHIVGTISEKSLYEISKNIKENSKFSFFLVGKVSKGCGKVFVIDSTGHKEILNNKGFQHFT
ncbi:MAG TPA: thiamine-phosphate kinase [Candidatus Nitrosocosmicus sp.]|nr:thiamine-phosphate kinase [Candidatus Nitrosocosmicus sp.]